MNIIVAVYSDWGIGCSGTQQIVLPEDRQFFRQMTDGGVIIAGRRTFEDFKKPLPNRRNIIITQNREYKVPGAAVVHTIDELRSELHGVQNKSKVFVIGGESVYRLLLPFCGYAYVTKLDAAPRSDTFFPDLDLHPDWSLDHCGEALESGGVRYRICGYINNAAEDIYV